MESVEHKKERLEPLFFMLLWARTPLTIVAHRFPGRRVVVRPTLGAIGSISAARYHGGDACLSTAAKVGVATANAIDRAVAPTIPSFDIALLHKNLKQNHRR